MLFLILLVNLPVQSMKQSIVYCQRLHAHTLIHSFILSDSCSYISSFIHSFIHSFVRSLVVFFCFESFVRQFIYSFVRSFVCLLSNCIIHSLFHLWCCHNISSFFIKRPKKYHQYPKKNVMLGFPERKTATLFKRSLYTNARNKQVLQKTEYQETHPSRATDKRRFSSMDQRCLYD